VLLFDIRTNIIELFVYNKPEFKYYQITYSALLKLLTMVTYNLMSVKMCNVNVGLSNSINIFKCQFLTERHKKWLK